jgi:hypothetical protein
MKTRQQLILDFMLAIMSGAAAGELDASDVYDLAAQLADTYLERM